jgi:uncharacterized protein YbaR (Trm112 family)
MKKKILDVLCCPTCKGELKINIDKQEKDEIITGKLFCKTCKCKYSMEDGIPNLLPK